MHPNSTLRALSLLSLAALCVPLMIVSGLALSRPVIAVIGAHGTGKNSVSEARGDEDNDDEGKGA